MQQFIVSGVGRSGTTAMARAINLHPLALCAVEQIDHTINHTDLLNDPGGALFRANPSSEHLRYNYGALDAKRANQLAAVGNKWPQYFLRWDGVLNEMHDPVAIVMVRSLSDVMASWQARVDDGSFPADYASCYAAMDFLDQILCATQSPFAERTLFVSYRALLFGNRCESVFAQSLQHLRLDPSSKVVAAFLGQYANDGHIPPRQALPAGSLSHLAELAPTEPFVREIDERGACQATETETATETLCAAFAMIPALRDAFEVLLVDRAASEFRAHARLRCHDKQSFFYVMRESARAAGRPYSHG